MWISSILIDWRPLDSSSQTINHYYLRHHGYNFMRFVIACLIGLICYLYSFSTGSANDSALDEYIRADDGAFTYDVVSIQRKERSSVYELKLTSQVWLAQGLVDRVLWKHWLTVVVPDKVESSTGFLFITGGSNKQDKPDQNLTDLLKIAKLTKTVVARLKQVPNQPLIFENKSGELYEDALIAYAWNKYLSTLDPNWIPRLPMAKSAVKAMDAVQDLTKSFGVKKVLVNDFVVSGASKRGWTTWVTCAVDKRVKGIIPIVIDMLNLLDSMEHHWSSYGFYAPAIGDYERGSIMNWRGSEEFNSLLKLVEPFELRNRLRMPKYILNASGDEYFLPDSWRFYFRQLEGPKYLRYVPNTDHSLKGSDALDSMISFHYSLAYDKDFPKVSWEAKPDGYFAAWSKKKPSKVTLWTAYNEKARDFRVEAVGKIWKPTLLKPDEVGKYSTKIEIPDQGWKASLIEFTYEDDEFPVPIKISTGTHIFPDFLPFDFDTGNKKQRPRF